MGANYKMAIGMLVLCVLVAGSFVDVVNADIHDDCLAACKADCDRKPQALGYPSAEACKTKCPNSC